MTEDCECPICYEPIQANVNIVVTECGHKFHCKCLMMNSSMNGFSCPCCRSEMVEEDDEEEQDFETDIQRGWREITDMVNANEGLRRQFTTLGNEDTMEFEEGEIEETEFERFVAIQRKDEFVREVPYILGSFRMFTQRIEGEEPEEEQDVDAEERERNEKEAEINTRILKNIMRRVTNKTITPEELVKAILYQSFKPDYRETYYKVFGKFKGAIMSATQVLQEE